MRAIRVSSRLRGRTLIKNSPRIALFYVAVFTALGILVPYWPWWLESRGLNAREIAWLQTAAIGARTFAAPAWGRYCDRHVRHRSTMRMLAVVALLTALPFLLDLGFAAMLATFVVFSLFYPPLIPLLDAKTIRTRNTDYPRTRLWGSLAFLMTSIVVGAFLEHHTRSWILTILLGELGLIVVTSLMLPPDAPVPVPPRAPIRSVLHRRGFVWLLLSVAMIQGSHGCYYTFGTMHWRAAGIAEGTIGWLVAEGVIAEVLLFWFATRLLRGRPSRWLLAAAAGAAVRWTMTGASTAVGVLLAAQWLHAVTFGVTHLSAVRWIAIHIPHEETATAQTLMSACSVGLGIGLATIVSGELFARLDGAAFFMMVAMAAAGAAFALLLQRRMRS